MSLDPTTDATVRIGDADREHAVAALGRHLSVGRLTMAEFENRLDTAYAATTRADPDAVLADLPAATRPSPPPQPVPFAPAALGGSSAMGDSGALGGVDPDRRHLPAHLDRHFGSPGPPALFLAVLGDRPLGCDVSGAHRGRPHPTAQPVGLLERVADHR